MISPEIIQEAINRLATAYDPTTVYLYGKYAWGTPDDDDDLNFLIVVESSTEKAYKRGDRAFDALLSLKIPTNIGVFTQKEFEPFSQNPTSPTYEIKHKGKIVYARD